MEADSQSLALVIQVRGKFQLLLRRPIMQCFKRRLWCQKKELLPWPRQPYSNTQISFASQSSVFLLQQNLEDINNDLLLKNSIPHFFFFFSQPGRILDLTRCGYLPIDLFSVVDSSSDLHQSANPAPKNSAYEQGSH